MVYELWMWIRVPLAAALSGKNISVTMHPLNFEFLGQ